jgi:hypothetical protein
MIDAPWWLTLLNALLCVAWSSATLWLLRLLWVRGRQLWPHVRDIFGAEGNRLLAFLCVSPFFLDSLAKIIAGPLRLLYASVFLLPLQSLEPHLVPGEEGSTPQVLQQTAHTLYTGLLQELAAVQDSAPFSQLVLLLLSWMVVGQIFKLLFTPDEAHPSENSRVLARALRGIGIARAMLVLFLAIGLSMCVASIISISELQEASDLDSQAPSYELLRERLEGSRIELKANYPVNPEDAREPVSRLRALVESQESAPGMTPEQLARLSAVEARLAFIEGGRRRLQRALQELAEGSQGRFERMTRDALTVYEVASGSRWGVREQRKHFLAILQWHQVMRFGLIKQLATCGQEVSSTEQVWGAWAAARYRDLTEQHAPEGAGGGDTEKLRAELNEALAQCTHLLIEPPPRRAEAGASLGPLKTLAGWLLETESLQLALIVGMLGAGLLGSAVASFLHARGDSPEATAAELTSVVVRGVTAAIVLFLALQGGLSTMVVSPGGSGPRPNPYVLLLVCFVAAVFSEHVWEAARARFTRQLGTDAPAPDASKSAGGRVGK